MRKTIDLKCFNAVKTLVAGGATTQEVTEYLGISKASVNRIRCSENFDEYRAIIAAMSIEMKNKQKGKAEEKKEEQPVRNQTVTIQPTWQMMQEMQKTNELLALISNKLAYIVEQLT